MVSTADIGGSFHQLGRGPWNRVTMAIECKSSANRPWLFLASGQLGRCRGVWDHFDGYPAHPRFWEDVKKVHGDGPMGEHPGLFRVPLAVDDVPSAHAVVDVFRGQRTASKRQNSNESSGREDLDPANDPDRNREIRDRSYDACLSAVSAARALATSDAFLTLAIPVVVTAAPMLLCRSSLDHDDLELVRCTRARLVLTDVSSGTITTVEVFHESKVASLVEEYTHSADRILDLVRTPSKRDFTDDAP